MLTVDSVFDLQSAIEEHLGALSDNIEEALEAGFRTGALRIGHEGSFNADDPRIQRIVAQLNDQMRDVPQTTRNILNEVVLSGREDPSKSVADIADDMVARVDDMAHGSDASSTTGGLAQSRAKRIAATTDTAAFNASQESAWAEAGVLGSTWMSQRDGRVSEGHFEADGQTRQLGTPFLVRRTFDKSREEMKHPGDPEARASNVVNCRCDRLPVTSREALEEELQNQPDLMA